MLSISLLAKSLHGCHIAGNASRLGLSSLGVDHRLGVLRQGYYGCQPRLASLATKSEVPKPLKRPASPFLAYANERRTDFKSTHPGTTQAKVIQKQLAEEWNNLPEERRKHYETTFSEKMVLYKAAEEHWWSKLTDEQKKIYLSTRKEIKESIQKKRLRRQLRLMGKPTRPRSPSNFYIAAQIKSTSETGKAKVSNYFNIYWDVIKGSRQSTENSHTSKAKLQQVSFSSATKSWKAVSDEEKQKYIDLADKDKLRYVSENEAWNLRMLKEGHGDVLREVEQKRLVIKRKNRSTTPHTEDGDDVLPSVEPKAARKPRNAKTEPVS